MHSFVRELVRSGRELGSMEECSTGETLTGLVLRGRKKRLEMMRLNLNLMRLKKMVPGGRRKNLSSLMVGWDTL